MLMHWLNGLERGKHGVWSLVNRALELRSGENLNDLMELNYSVFNHLCVQKHRWILLPPH